jgi:hypothetical protein
MTYSRGADVNSRHERLQGALSQPPTSRARPQVLVPAHYLAAILAILGHSQAFHRHSTASVIERARLMCVPSCPLSPSHPFPLRPLSLPVGQCMHCVACGVYASRPLTPLVVLS